MFGQAGHPHGHQALGLLCGLVHLHPGAVWHLDHLVGAGGGIAQIPQADGGTLVHSRLGLISGHIGQGQGDWISVVRSH